MVELPRGTVTLLFTDIEGSTRLLRQLGERYSEVLDTQRRILRQAADAHGGREVDTQGDSFFFAFARANTAVGAAVAAQRALAANDWPEAAKLGVRMGMHTAEPEVGEERYVGLGVHLAARIGAAAHGGQVLLSSTTRALVEDEVRGVAVRDLGTYRLKDFDRPERLYQLDIDGLPSRFPPVRAEAAPSRRRRLLFAAAGLLAAGLAATAALAFTSRGGNTTKVGPTSLAVIDPGSNKVVDAVELGFKSNLIAAGEGKIWVVDPDGSTLWRIDPQTRAVKPFGIGLGTDAVPFGIAAGRGAVWLAVLRGSRQVVLELSPRLLNTVRTIRYGAEGSGAILFKLAQPLAVGGGAVWAIDAVEGAIWRIDPRKGTLAEGLDATALAAEPEGVWTAGLSAVVKTDPVTGENLGTGAIPSDRFAQLTSIGLGLRSAWLVRSSAGVLWRVASEPVATIDHFTVGSGPSGVAVGEGSVWVANSRDGTVSRVDPRTRKSVTIDLGSPPGGIVAAFGSVWTSPGEPQS